MINWDDYPNFSADEFRCRFSHRADMDPEFMEMLQELRTRYGRPLKINSGFRDRYKHPIEARKNTRGAHTTGKACDISIRGKEAFVLLSLALDIGFTGIGVSQKGGSRFLHLDIATKKDLGGTARPNLWSY